MKGMNLWDILYVGYYTSIILIIHVLSIHMF